MIGTGGVFGQPGPGHFTVNKFGRNPDVDTGTTPEDIWSGGGEYPFPSSPVSLEILSSAAADDDGDTGANTVEIEGLDANWELQTETVTMNGVAAVNLAKQYIRIFRAKVLTAGTDGENAGIITIRDQGAGTIRAIIDFNAALGGGAGQTLMAIYTIPAGKKGVIRRHWARLDRFPGTDAQMRIVIRPFGGAWLTKETWSISETNNHDVEYPNGAGIEVTEKTDIRMEVFVVGANDVVIDAGFDIEGEDA